ncbi:MAG: YaaR family protein [Clostridiales bacterium]|nr:YaaR family protein [Clostridiales bacterium]
MNKISKINTVNINNLVNQNTKQVKESQQTFSTKFQNIKSEQVRGHLEKLYSQIGQQADRLADKLDINEVVRYKKLVKDFLDIAVKNSHQFSKQNFLDRRGRHRVYCIVKNIDRELDELTKNFLSQEEDRMSIIKRLDDIRGLLLDVLM